MTDITKLTQEIRRAAVKIGVEIWRAEGGSVITSDYLVDGVTCCDHVADFETVNGVSNYAEFVAAANPANVLVITHALEKEKERAEEAEKQLKRAKGEVEYLQHGYNTLGKLAKEQAEQLVEYEKASGEPVPDELTDDDLEAKLKSSWADSFRGGWNACREAMLSGSTTKPASELDSSPKSGELSSTPAGWKLVPVEPTPEMIAAAMDSNDVSFDAENDYVFVHHDAIYEAMINAAPQPEGESHD